MPEPDPNGADGVAKYVKLQSGYYLDPAVAGLSEAAEIAFVRSIAYCGSAETHGYVPDAVLTSVVRRQSVRAASKVCQELVTATLWIKVPGGYQLRTWAENQSELEALLSRRKNDAARQRKRRNGGVDNHAGDQEMSRDIERDTHARSREERREELQTLIPLVRRQLFGDARETTTTDDELVTIWSEVAGPKTDLRAELMAWLVFNGTKPPANPGAALLGWLRHAAKRSGPLTAGCGECLQGWTPDEFGQPSAAPCKACRPHLKAVGES